MQVDLPFEANHLSHRPGFEFPSSHLLQVLYESDVTFSPKNFPYNADVIAVWTNEIGLLQISNRYYMSSQFIFY